MMTIATRKKIDKEVVSDARRIARRRNERSGSSEEEDSMLMRMLSLDEVLRNPAMLAHQPPGEIAETRIAAHAAAAALDAAHDAAVGETQAKPAVTGEPGLLNAAEAATYLNVKESFIRVAGRRGDLAAIQVGRYVRYERKALDDFARRQRRRK